MVFLGMFIIMHFFFKQNIVEIEITNVHHFKFVWKLRQKVHFIVDCMEN